MMNTNMKHLKTLGTNWFRSRSQILQIIINYAKTKHPRIVNLKVGTSKTPCRNDQKRTKRKKPVGKTKRPTIDSRLLRTMKNRFPPATGATNSAAAGETYYPNPTLGQTRTPIKSYKMKKKTKSQFSGASARGKKKSRTGR